MNVVEIKICQSGDSFDGYTFTEQSLTSISGHVPVKHHDVIVGSVSNFEAIGGTLYGTMCINDASLASAIRNGAQHAIFNCRPSVNIGIVTPLSFTIV